jgi:hypothetical protein
MKKKGKVVVRVACRDTYPQIGRLINITERLDDCYFLAMESAKNPVLGRQTRWHRTMQLVN